MTEFLEEALEEFFRRTGYYQNWYDLLDAVRERMDSGEGEWPKITPPKTDPVKPKGPGQLLGWNEDCGTVIFWVFSRGRGRAALVVKTKDFDPEKHRDPEEPERPSASGK